MTAYYPLQWPAQWPRTTNPEWSRFDTTITKAVDSLYNELRLMEASDIQLTSNAKIGKSGIILSEQRWIEDAGVAVYFTANGRDVCIPCDKWVYVHDNIRAIAKTIEALRGIERWGTKQIVEAAFMGFAALPGGDRWWEVLHVTPDATREEIVRQYRQLVKRHHPDAGGDPEEFHRIQQAYEQAVAA